MGAVKLFKHVMHVEKKTLFVAQTCWNINNDETD